MSRRGRVLIAVACALLAGLPFLNKAFTIDDTPVLKIARQITEDPLRPFSGEINWRNDPEPMFEVTTNPPFLSYVLAPLVAVYGLDEVVLHVPMLGFLLILAVAMVALSARFSSNSLWPVLFVLSTPAVVVSLNVMRDVPAIALSAASVAAFVWGSDRRRRRLLALGAFLAGCAMLTKYSSLILFPVLGLYALLRKRPRDLAWLAIPLVMVALWSFQNILVHGQTHLGYLAQNRFDEKGFSRVSRFFSLMTIVGSLIWLWPVACVHDLLRRKSLRILPWGVALLLGFGLAIHPPAPRATPSFFLWAAAGVCLLVWILWEGTSEWWREARVDGGEDTLFLMGWMLAGFGVAVFGVFFQAVRHLLPALPAMVLLVSRVLYRSGLEHRLRPVLTVCLVVQSALSAALGTADAQFADAGRRFIRDEVPGLKKSGAEIWFCGNWGFRTYAEAAGLEDVLLRPPWPPEGSLILWPVMTHKSRFSPELRKALILKKEYSYQGSVPIRTMSDRAGFYSTVRWKVPFRVTRDPKEIIRVYEVGPMPGRR